MTIIQTRHPEYTKFSGDWSDWRTTYEGGKAFVNYFLKRYSVREDNIDFRFRLSITPIPAFAKAAINEIIQSVYNRATDIIRKGGPASYQQTVNGLFGGVDRGGLSMSNFMAERVLPELLVMSRVGVFVDMPELDNNTLLGKIGKNPYLYRYRIEDILSWKYENNQLVSLLLRDIDYKDEEQYALPATEVESYRYLHLDKTVHVIFFDKDGNKTGIQEIEIPKIPFVMPDIETSLLAEAYAYQVALLNLTSSDVYNAIVSNFPFYTEQKDHIGTSVYTKNEEEDVELGPSRGRFYGKGLDRPGFISPPKEPLEISLKLQESLKRDLRELVHLAVNKLNTFDPLESGLSAIASIAQRTEQEIADIWALYEGTASARVNYPQSYALPDPEQNRNDIRLDLELLEKINSERYRKTVAKKIVRKDIGNEIDINTLDEIFEEIDNNLAVAADSKAIRNDIEMGLVSARTASEIRGYPANEIEDAKAEHAERLARIAAAQSPGGFNQARGIADQSVNPNEGKEEKVLSRDNTFNGVPADATRGEGR